jgi:hypothetical protein
LAMMISVRMKVVIAAGIHWQCQRTACSPPMEAVARIGVVTPLGELLPLPGALHVLSAFR